MAEPDRAGPDRAGPDRAGPDRAGRGGPHEQLRLMTLASRLYHERGIRQRDIAARLGISQPRVSRLLAQAHEEGVVRTVVVAPEGIHPESEEALEELYGLRECHVVEVHEGDEAIPRELGTTAARCLVEAAPWGPRIGFTSWSSTLREMARALDPVRRSGAAHVVEMLGDLGAPLLQHEAGHATLRLATALGAEPVLLRTPGVFATPATVAPRWPIGFGRLKRKEDARFIRGEGTYLDDIRLPGMVHGAMLRSPYAHAKILSIDTSAALARDGVEAVFTGEDLDLEAPLPLAWVPPGVDVATPLDDLVVAITLDQLRAAETRVVVAGGASKWEPLHAALRGGWVDVLVTDLTSARYLIAHAD